MELWIRSQDKEGLIKVNMGIMYWKDTDNRNCVVNKDNATGISKLGTYKTKERALEVLDDIQNMLRFFKGEGFTGEGLISIENNLGIYQMPKE